MSISQVISLGLENLGNLNFTVSCTLALYTPTAVEYLDLDFFTDLHKFK